MKLSKWFQKKVLRGWVGYVLKGTLSLLCIYFFYDLVYEATIIKPPEGKMPILFWIFMWPIGIMLFAGFDPPKKEA